ncbi:hypothetical protein Tco_0974779 [Tanacetum coccineum]|uniref:Uncharacterized protein n=1 Tax=Tanacetum coccineum TaxID=301880 RepID=A0ABQ5ECP6_9ASTR
MKRGYAGDIVPLLHAMLASVAMDQGEGSAQPAKPHPTPVDPLPSTSLPPNQSPPHSLHQSPPHSPHQSPPHSPHQLPPHSPFQSPPYSPPYSSLPRSYEAPLPEGNTSRSAEAVVERSAGDGGKRYRRRARSMAKKINTELDAEDEINTGRVEINSAILKDFSRDDLIELYRLVIKKYRANRPEEMYDRVLWGDLKTMFNPPLNRKYPLSKDACQVMLKMKLLDGTMDEVCYQLLKMIKKQDGIRK